MGRTQISDNAGDRMTRLHCSGFASAGTTAENENIAFDWAYIQYVSPIGTFLVGYQQDGAWGTVFGDNSVPLAKIQYVIRTGPVTAGAYAGKITRA